MACNTREHAAALRPLEAITRRGALQLSLGAALSTLFGPTLPRVFGSQSASASRSTNEKSVILLWLEGGPFQQDSFDPKSTRDEKLGLKFHPISTTADGLQLAGCLPKLAEQGRHLTLIRSLRGLEKEHTLAQYYMQTGYRATGPIQSPAMGSIVAHELGPLPMRRADPDGIPPYISIGRAGFSAGHFGSAYRPYLVWDPSKGPDNLGLPNGISPEAQARRLGWLKAIEAGRPTSEASKQIQSGQRAALAFMRSKQRAAFDLSREPLNVREAYGRDDAFGQGCLLARRLVVAGARFVQVRLASFDQHSKHYPEHERLMRVLDRGMAALVADLSERGLLESTTVIAVGEFGRTPCINKNLGRDHFIDGFSVALAGGGFKRGFVHGSTTVDGAEIRDHAVTVPDLLATLCHDLGIDPTKEFTDQFGRPIKLVDHGKIVREVLARG